MPDQLPYCIHCGARQLNADSKFCHQCGQPIVPVKPSLGKAAPWLAPVLVSAAIVVVAAVVLTSVLSRGPTTSKPTAATPTTAVQAQAARATPTSVAGALVITTPLPPTPTETPQPTPTLTNVPPEPVKLTKMVWSPDGKLLAVGSGTGVYLYDTTTWQELRFIPVKVNIPPLPDDAPAELAFSFDSTMLAAAIGRAVQVWRVADGVLAYTIQGVKPLAASPTDGLWATFPPFGTSEAAIAIHLWRTSDGQLVRTIPNALLHPNTMAFSPDGSLLAVGSAPGDPPGMWQVADSRQVAQLNWPNAERYFWQSVAFHPNSTTVASAGSDIAMGVQNVFVLWDARRGAVIREVIGQSAPSQQANIRRVCYAPDGSLLATYFGDYSGRENRVQLWSAGGAAGRSWSLPGPASDIGFTPDGKLLAIAEGERIAFYDPATGTLMRQVAPQWHQGILPTPTPLHAGLQVPLDWLTYYNVIRFPGFRLMHPLTWEESGKSDFSVSLRKKPTSTQDTPMLKEVRVSPGLSCDPASRVSVDNIKKHRSEMINGGVFVTSGEWPYLIPAVFAEFEVQIDPLWAEGLGMPGQSKIREIDLVWSYAGNRCSSATLTFSHELGEQDRLDVSLMLASIQFEDETHRFPTVTPTFTPTPNLLPRPALPVQLTLKAEKVRTGDYEGSHITIEVKDAHGQPVNGAEVTLILQRWGRTRLGVTREGRVETAGGGDILNEKATVEVYWNQELIAQQDFVVSWQ